VQANFIIFIGIGGFLGAISRYMLSIGATSLFGDTLPFGTLSVNVLGSFIIGFLALYFEQHIAPEYRALFITGFLGALTTFSSYSLETTLLIEQHLYLKALTHTLLNVTLSVGATILGMGVFKNYFYP
jgi:CrcB protein